MPLSSLPPGHATVAPRFGVSGTAVVAARMDTAFAHRTWSVPGLGQRLPCHLFLVAHGRAEFFAEDGPGTDLVAPVILWLPRSVRGEFRLPAGSDGVSVAVAEELVLRIVGDSPMAAHLRLLFDRTVIAPPERLAPQLAEVAALFAALVRESHDPQAGTSAMVSLYLGLILMHLWRASGIEPGTAARGTGATTVQRFRQLIELHYRDGIRIDRFAEMLGVTRTHLHEACLRATERTPLALLHERLIHEARLRLEQTDLAVETVAYGLGFRDAAYFNRFFKRLTGQSPGAYRRAAARPAGEAPSFAAWP